MWGIIKFCHVAQLHHIININNMEWIGSKIIWNGLKYFYYYLNYNFLKKNYNIPTLFFNPLIVLYFNLKFVMDLSAQF